MIIDLGFVPPFPLDLALLSAAAGLSLVGLIVAIIAVRRIGAKSAEAERSAQAYAATIAELDRRQERFERMVIDTLTASRRETGDSAKLLREEVATQVRGLTDGVTMQVRTLSETLATTLKTYSEATHAQSVRMQDIQRNQHTSFEQRLAALSEVHGKAGENLRKTFEQQMTVLRTENSTKLEQMRATVDEKLQTTLERRLGESFTVVSERLEAVHKGLGEMQSLATGVGDLKRVLTNVKTRGTWGEVQLETLLQQILTPDQFRKNVAVVPTSSERVEFTVVLPGQGADEHVLLPIDCKFPVEDYDRLQQAAERGDTAEVEAASRALELRFRKAAKDISDKYIHPPYTTDFAIMFLPTEGLYAEALRRPGFVDDLQRTFRVTLAGPTNLAAILNTFRMGFRTLAIQQQSSEVWRVLGAVKTEFGKFGPMLVKVKKKLQEATNTIEDVETRKRVMDRKLRDVESLPSGETVTMIGGPANDDTDPGDQMVEDVADIIRGTPDMFVAAETDDRRVARSTFFGDED